jgi:hypothetical protein
MRTTRRIAFHTDFVNSDRMNTAQQSDEFVTAIRDVVELTHYSGAFLSEALGLARRAIGA